MHAGSFLELVDDNEVYVDGCICMADWDSLDPEKLNEFFWAIALSGHEDTIS